MSELLAPENMPFAVALALLGLLVVIQALGLGHLFPDADFDSDISTGDFEVGGALSSLTGFGHVPLIVWLSCFLAAFGLIGLSLQQLLTSFLGAPLTAIAAAAVAFVFTVPVNAGATRLLGRVWPRVETTAISLEALLGRRGQIAIGRASRGNPARAVVRDAHGQAHNVMIEPHDDDVSFAEGDEVLLVRREGDLFFALDGQGPIRLV